MMIQVSRRDLFRTVAGTAGAAGVAAALGPLRAFAQETPAAAPAGQSGLITGTLKRPAYAEIPGFLSKEQVTPHVEAHYGGALMAYVEIEDTFAKVRAGEMKPDKRQFRELKQEHVSRANSVALHEFYFDGLAPKPGDPPEDLRKAIAERFGSLDRWIEDFQACANAAQGWALLVLHPVNRKLYNVVLDAHDIGPVVMGIPVAALDVYEHAFYVDYKNKKGDYVSASGKFLNWVEMNRRFMATAQ